MIVAIFSSKLSRAVASKTRRSLLCFSTNGGVGTKGTPPPAATLCQVNNHPNYRLKQAKERFAARDLRKGKSVKPKQIMFTTPKRQKAPPPHVKYHKTVREHGISLQPNENSPVSNDGTSSGAIAAERLRIARRKAVERLGLPIGDVPSEHLTNKTSECSKEIRSHEKPVNEHGLDIVVNENPVRSNDGTSSGAKAADRLRLARRKALESLKSQPTVDITVKQTSNTTDTNCTEKNFYLNTVDNTIHGRSVKEHGLDIVAYENPVRSNDGTSSGATAAERLRFARRKVLQSMKESPADSK